MIKKYTEFKKRAILLRKRGWSYKEIEKKLPVARSTLSLWLRYIPLKPEHKERLYTKQVKMMALGSQSQKERRKREIEKIISEAQKEVKLPLSDEAYKYFGLALYWAEGDKKSDFEITNSDPQLIIFIVKWFEHVLNTSSKNMTATLNIYPQQDEITIKKFWSDLTGIPVENFRKSFVKPISSGYKKNNLYYGTIRVRLPKGTDMRIRLFGWLKAILQKTAPVVESVERKWFRLRETPRPINLI